MSSWSGDTKRAPRVPSIRVSGCITRPLAIVFLIILLLSCCSNRASASGITCFAGPAWDNYVGAVIEDGDYLNDWLTHMDPVCRPVVLQVGRRIAGVQGLAGIAALDDDNVNVWYGAE